MAEDKKAFPLVSGICIWFSLSFVLALFLVPYKEIFAQRYLAQKLYGSILIIFQQQWVLALIICSLPVFLIMMAVRYWRWRYPFVLSALVAFVLLYLVRSPVGAVLSALQPSPLFLHSMMLLPVLMLVFLIFNLKRLFGSVLFKGGLVLLVVLLLGVNVFIFQVRIKKGPNVLLVVVDTLRTDYTAVGQGAKGLTPMLANSLMKEGVTFSHCYATSPWTLPSIASLLTSQYPSSLGIFNLVSKLDKQDLTLAELLKDKGYRTAAIISHLLLSRKYGFDQGFDHYNEKNISDKYGNHFAISSPGVTQDALQFLKQNRGKKFFLFLHYFDPHYIYVDHEKRMAYQGAFTSRDIKKMRDMIRKGEYKEEDIDYLRYCYSTEVTFTDRHIGRLIQELRNLKLYDNTLIVFAADHGEEFVERGWLGHSTTVYDEQVRVPLVIKPAGSGAPEWHPRMEARGVSNVDIVPTICGLLNFSRSEEFQGEDLFAADLDDHDVYSEVQQSRFGTLIDRVSVVNQGWKLIKDFVANQYELYDLRRDPEERLNRGAEISQVSARLKMKLNKWIKDNRMKKRGNRRGSLTKEERARLKSLGYLQ